MYTLVWKNAETDTPVYPNKKMVVRTTGRHWDFEFAYLSIDGWRRYDNEEPILYVIEFLEFQN